MVLPVLVVVLVILLWGLSVAAAQIRCIDASRVAVRGLARGEDYATVRSMAAAAAPAGARIELSVESGRVVVRVTARIAPPGGLAAGLATVSVGSDATARREDVP